ncbi:MAG: hypothetical protein KKA56_02125, partial [Gammaproteobacteria bacterium]|nr:hypothetical protein [Gammaproteobacteria bacterium]
DEMTRILIKELNKAANRFINSVLNKLLLAFCVTVFTTIISAADLATDVEKVARQEYPTDTLYRAWLDYQKDEKSIVNFYQALPQKHLIELNRNNPKKATVTYFAKGGTDTDYILQSGGPDFYGLRFKQFGHSPIFFCVQEIPRDAWFSYGVNEFKRVKKSTLGGVEPTSMVHIDDGAVIGPDAPLSPYIHARANTPKGELKQLTFNSKFMGEGRRVVAYIPAAYNADVAHNLVIQFDGQNYARAPEHGAAWEGWSPMPTILDNLIHDKKIAPTITLFIQNQGNRSGDLLSEKMSDFVALELVDWARKNYNISKSTANIVVSGPSRGGFAAASTALRHSNLIGAVLSQSGSFYYRLQNEENWPVYPEFEGQLLLDYKHSAKLDIRFYLDVGLYDLGLGAVGTNRQLRDILDLKGYRVTYYQYKGGHSHLGWRHTLANGLISLLGEHQK